MSLPPTGIERNREIILGLAFARVAVAEWNALSPQYRELALDALEAATDEAATIMVMQTEELQLGELEVRL